LGDGGRGSEAIRKSLVMEFEAMHLYTLMAARSEDGEARRVLLYLAESEEAHAERLMRLLPAPRPGEKEAPAGIDMVKALREKGWRSYRDRATAAGLTERSPVDDYLAFALAAEKAARERYERLSGLEEDPRLAALYRALAREETGHAERLEAVREQLGRTGAAPGP
jgi:rubrerythrin